MPTRSAIEGCRTVARGRGLVGSGRRALRRIVGAAAPVLVPVPVTMPDASRVALARRRAERADHPAGQAGGLWCRW